MTRADVSADGAIPVATWSIRAGATSGRFEGAGHGSDVSFFVVDAAAGEGPALHRHPYSETFVVQSGRGRFRLGDRSLEAVGGDVVVVPPATPHRFTALGPARLRLVAIHAAPVMETTWLEDDRP